jgi:hypothetical protein
VNIRTSIINQLIQRYGAKTYLEIGCQNRENNFNHIDCEYKRCVDIDPAAKPDFLMSSDDFFVQNGLFDWDVIFIDGDHSYEQASRDLMHALDLTTKLIFMHDTHPLNEQYTQPGWSGEVYKVIIDLYNGIPGTNKYQTYLEDKHGLTVIYPTIEGHRGKLECGSYKEFDRMKQEILNIQPWR